MGTSVPGGQGSIVGRMIGAAMLNVNTYEEVEHDATATGQAGVVVALVAVCTGVGMLFMRGGIGALFGGIVAAILGWLLGSGIVYFVGTRLFGGTATWGEVLRTMGFAQAPGVLRILGFIPLLGWLVHIVVAVWMLVTSVIAIRQALDVDTGKAILTALVSWLVTMVIGAMIGAVFGVGLGVAGAFSR